MCTTNDLEMLRNQTKIDDTHTHMHLVVRLEASHMGNSTKNNYNNTLGIKTAV